jgi:putative oxidoreductase
MALDAGIAVLRITIGLIFAAHGAQKAFGWWKGPGYAGWTSAIGKMGFRPVVVWAFISVAAELGAGLLLALGLLIPLAAAGLVGQGIVIIARVHWANGFWSRDGGYEYPLALLGGSIAIALTGPGGWSLDAGLPVGVLYQALVRWGALLVAIAVAAVVAFLANRQAAAG